MGIQGTEKDFSRLWQSHYLQNIYQRLKQSYSS